MKSNCLENIRTVHCVDLGNLTPLRNMFGLYIQAWQKPEAVAWMCSVLKKMFLNISQNSLKNSSARASFLTKLHA